jgi:hypothetical protein
MTVALNTSVSLQEAAMSELLQAKLDRTLKFHREHRLGDEANAERTIDDQYLKRKRKAERFCTEVRSVIQEVAARANSYFAIGHAGLELRDVSGYYTGPLYPGGSGCNPLAYELRVNGLEAGGALIVELAPDGTIEAFLAALRPLVPGDRAEKINLEWGPVALDGFDADAASDILARYMTAVSSRCGLDLAQVSALRVFARGVGEGAA